MTNDLGETVAAGGRGERALPNTRFCMKEACVNPCLPVLTFGLCVQKALRGRGRTALALMVAFVVSMGATSGQAQGPGVQIESKKKPDTNWRKFDTLSVADVMGKNAGTPAPLELSRFGGLLSKNLKATGFFHVKRSRGRWWLVDPEGHPLIRMSVNSVYRRTKTAPDGTRLEIPDRFEKNGGALWAAQTKDLLLDLGFNGFGRWAEFEVFNDSGQRFPYMTSLNMMAGFERRLRRASAKNGHGKGDEEIIPVFHADFPAFCDKIARDTAEKHRDDPWLVGHYTDNEMPAPRDLLERTLKVDPKDPRYKDNYIQARRFLRSRHGRRGTIDDITEKDNLDFVGLAFKTYYKITSDAMRRHDPNHMVWGSRLHGSGTKIPQITAGAAAHLDVISYNLYGVWNVPDDRRKMWETAGRRRPFVVSEFCIKGEDTGKDNTEGAGWIVRTQRERGLWYQNFTINLLRSKHCIGWDYFKYRDDIDVNKGILDGEYQPYPGFADAIQELHHAAYELVDRLDRGSRRR